MKRYSCAKIYGDAEMREDPEGDFVTLMSVRELLGFLSASIPDLHGVEVPLLAEALDRFLALPND